MAESGNIGKRGCEEDAVKNDEQLCLLFDWTMFQCWVSFLWVLLLALSLENS